MHCAWSWSISTGWTSHNAGVSGENRTIAFMQPTSEPSGDIWRKRQRISCMVFISLAVNASFGIRSLTWTLSSNVPKSNGTLHWARFSKNNSFHDSCLVKIQYTKDWFFVGLFLLQSFKIWDISFRERFILQWINFLWTYNDFSLDGCQQNAVKARLKSMDYLLTAWK